MYSFNIRKEKDYFLLPASPTPNGRMHLGHIAGPYLKMDILKRKVQRGGGNSFLVSGSDVYESHIEIKATQLNISEEDVCNRFHELIVKDFEALDIEFDLFINPLETVYRERFASRERELFQDLIDSGKVVQQEETFIYDTLQGRYLAGCWIKGKCPNCNSETGSYLCENCGLHYRPIDIFRSENYPGAELRKSSSLYLQLNPQRLSLAIEQVSNGKFLDIFQKYVELQGPYIRLTTPQDSGVEWTVNADERQVIFSYLANLLAYIFFADVCKEKFGLSENPLSKNSSFVTAVSFGTDTVLPFTAGLMAVGDTLSEYRSFDHYISNYLYNLNGEKFSTSRGNVIWGGDIVHLANVQSDLVRYYLTKQNPENEVKNFNVDDFIDTVNLVLYQRHNQSIDSACARAESGNMIENSLYQELEHLICQQNTCMEPPVFNFSGSLDPIERWVDLYNEWRDEERDVYAYWWLKGYALLAYPVMPDVSKKLWSHLSREIEIRLDNFFGDMTLQVPFESIPQFRTLTYDELAKCLPSRMLSDVS